MTPKHLAPDEAPPPYTPSDPLTPSSSNISTTGDAQPQANVEYVPLYSRSIVPANFISAAGYFQEHPPPREHELDEVVLEHALTIYARSKAKDYHRFPRCWRTRAEEISKHDWRTFLNYLLPPHLGYASDQPNLPPKLRAELRRDQKDRPQESGEERKNRIAAVVGEWNDLFFVPRGTAVIYCYGSEDGTASVSPLCPNCYPSSLRSRQSGQVASSRPRATTAPTPDGVSSLDPAPIPTNTEETVRNADAEPSARSETPRVNTTERRSGAPTAPSFGLLSGAVNTIQSWANRRAQLAQTCGEQAEAWGRAFGEHAESRGKALGKHAELRGRALGDRAGAWGKTMEQRSDWIGHMAGLYDPPRPGGGYGYGWGNERQARRSVSSSSSSSSSSEDSEDDSVSTISTDSDWDLDDIEVFRAQIRSVHDSFEHARTVFAQNPNDTPGLRQELITVKAALRELRVSTSRHVRGTRGRKPSTAEKRAIKEELRGIKRDYRALNRQARSERKNIRKEQKKRKKEEKKARKDARKASWKQRGKHGQQGQYGQRGEDIRVYSGEFDSVFFLLIRLAGTDPVGELEAGVVRIDIEDDNASRTHTREPSIPVPPEPEMPPIPVGPSPPVIPSLPDPLNFPEITSAYGGVWPYEGYYRHYHSPHIRHPFNHQPHIQQPHIQQPHLHSPHLHSPHLHLNQRGRGRGGRPGRGYGM